MVVLWRNNQRNLQSLSMERTITQGLIIVLLFAGTFLALNQVDWMELFEVKKNTARTEEKLGEIFWNAMRESETVTTDQFIIQTLDSLLSDLCRENNINRSQIKLHIIEKDEVNAFAMPGAHLVVFTGLIQAADDPAEISGVLGHELAHIELNHVMKKLVREIGLSTLIAVTTGDSNPQVISESIRLLSSSAFDRALEKEADIKAADYLIQANLDPEHFANFLFRMANASGTSEHILASWISTHPESEERARYVIEYSKDNRGGDKQVITGETWTELRNRIQTLQNESTQ